MPPHATGYKNGSLPLYDAAALSVLLFLPAAGYRDSSGEQHNVGNYGYYWSSTVSGAYSHYLFFLSTNVYPSSNNNRVPALACVV
ncbi:MAG: hypothetical protein LBT04_09500 [Prevotellaceae bacterium]|jgi:hypothetical protein|nr:hypothetical protein [Prevotellaceae bacterium]